MSLPNFKKTVFLSFLMTLAGAPALGKVTISKKFNSHEQQIINDSLSFIESRAPGGLMKKLSEKRINIVQRQFSAKNQEVASTDGTNIFLDSKVLDSSYFKNFLQTKTRHSHHKTFIAATLLHEMAHIIDIKKHTLHDEQFLTAHCRWNDMQLSAKDADICTALEQKKGLYSYSPSFLSSVGRQNAIGFERLNWNTQGSPDSYEFQSPREAFSVNMEYFVFDPNFACKKPAVNTVLTQMFGRPQHQKQDCADNTGIIYSTAGGITKTIKLSQIQEVSYLFASQGDGFASKYGHAMLYLTVCPEGKNPSEVSCEKDIEEHVAVSPAALVYRGLSFIDGLSGKYDFNYFVVPIMTAIEDYTVKELRNLEVYPLKLNTKEISATIADFVWNFTGKYYFMSNNCAHGVGNVINSVSSLNTMMGSGFSPLDLRDLLISKRLINRTPKTVFAADKTRLRIKRKRFSSGRDSLGKIGHNAASRKTNSL